MRKPQIQIDSMLFGIDWPTLAALLNNTWANFVRLTGLAVSFCFVVVGVDLLVPLEVPLQEQLCGLVVENASSVLAAIFVAITFPAVFQSLSKD